MSAEFQKWCQQQMIAFVGNDDIALTEFLMTVESVDEIHSYVREYLGASEESSRFTDEFLRRKNFERSAAPVVVESSASDEWQTSKSASNKKRSRKSKGAKVDPAMLGFTAPADR